MVVSDTILAKVVKKYTTHLTNHVTVRSLSLTRPDIGNNVFSPELFYSRYLSNFSFQSTNDEEMLENRDNIDIELEPSGSMDGDNDGRSLSD